MKMNSQIIKTIFASTAWMVLCAIGAFGVATLLKWNASRADQNETTASGFEQLSEKGLLDIRLAGRSTECVGTDG